jgi:hypothetical protein
MLNLEKTLMLDGIFMINLNFHPLGDILLAFHVTNPILTATGL